MALLTLLCLGQGDMVPTPTKRPRMISDDIADITPQEHAPCCCYNRRTTQFTASGRYRGSLPLSLKRTSTSPSPRLKTCALYATTRPSRFARERLSRRNHNPFLWKHETSPLRFAQPSFSPLPAPKCSIAHSTRARTPARSSACTPFLSLYSISLRHLRTLPD